MAHARLLAFVLTISGIALILALASWGDRPVRAGAIIVDQDDPECSLIGSPYCTIGAAVEDAQPGDTISVFPGTYDESVDLSEMAAPGDISLQAVDETGAPAVSTVTIDSPGGAAIATEGGPFPGLITIDGFTVSSPNDNGIFVDAVDDVMIRNVTSNDNGEDGILIRGNDNPVAVMDSTLNQNAGDGINVFDSNALVTISNVTANGNDEDGMELNVTGDVEITGSTANANEGIGFGGNGIDIPTTGEISISDTTTDDNAQDGVSTDVTDEARLAGILSGASSITVVGSSASGNGDDGFELDSTGTVTVTDSAGEANDDDAFDIIANSIVISGSRGDFNGDEGFEVGALESISFMESSAHDNEDDGFEVSSEGEVTVDRVTANDNDDDGFEIERLMTVGETSVTNSIFMGNASAGFDYSDDIVVGFNAPGPHLSTGNIICDNASAGMDLDWTATIDADGNWWGAASGPFHPVNNPDGDGNEVQDATSGANAGTIEFEPWIDMISGSNGEATVGQPTVVTFEFTGDDGAVALMEGPGDPSSAPVFTAETDNGTVETSGFIADGVLEVMLTPANAGTATVTVNGPCGLGDDLGGNSVELTVIAGTEVIWGDDDCNGAAGATDALKSLQDVAGIPYEQEEPCFPIGEPVAVSPAGFGELIWGDVDCDGDVDATDALGILRFVAGLPVNQEPGCPEIGEPVFVAE